MSVFAVSEMICLCPIMSLLSLPTVKLGLSSPGLNDCYSQSCESFDGLRLGGEKLGGNDERHHTHSSSSSVEKYDLLGCLPLSSVRWS